MSWWSERRLLVMICDAMYVGGWGVKKKGREDVVRDILRSIVLGK
jgi:hypothetical protein